MYKGARPTTGAWATCGHTPKEKWHSQQLSASIAPQLGMRPCELLAPTHAGPLSGLCIISLHDKDTVTWLMSNRQCLCCFHIKAFTQRCWVRRGMKKMFINVIKWLIFKGKWLLTGHYKLRYHWGVQTSCMMFVGIALLIHFSLAHSFSLLLIFRRWKILQLLSSYWVNTSLRIYDLNCKAYWVSLR